MHEYDMRPVDSDIYMSDVLDKGGKMIKALREWEKKRGIVHSFRGRFIEPKSKIVEEKPKPKPVKARPIVVPRDRKKPGRVPQFTKEEKRQRKNENNRRYRELHKEAAKARSKEWRAKLTPEQRDAIRKRLNEWRKAQRAAKKLAANHGGHGSAGAGLPLADAAQS